MYNVKLNGKAIKSELFANNTKLGDLMKITENCRYNGEILLHTYIGFICLNEPLATWGKDCSLRVELLEKGENVILTIE